MEEGFILKHCNNDDKQRVEIRYDRGLYCVSVYAEGKKRILKAVSADEILARICYTHFEDWLELQRREFRIG